MDQAGRYVADAVLGIDTLWGGDVMCPSGTGRFIADSWFSDEPLPAAYTQPGSQTSARIWRRFGQERGPPSGRRISASDRSARGDRRRPQRSRKTRRTARRISGGIGNVIGSHVGSRQGDPRQRRSAVPYARCVEASTGGRRSPLSPKPNERAWQSFSGRLAIRLQARQEFWAQSMHGVRIAWFPWPRCAHWGLPSLLTSTILAPRIYCLIFRKNLLRVPRANIDFLPIKDAWFSGSMNYLGRARKPDGSPKYEATYEINASLQISVPEFEQLVSHEVVPGHVTTFAYLQNLYARGNVGFETTVLTMNTRAATLFEGLANNAILMAHGVTEIEQLPDEDLQIGVLLALLQDDAKNQSSYLTWGEKKPKEEVAATLRRDFLVSEERADKLSGAWGRHPLLGRMYLPAYRSGTEKVAQLRRTYPADRILPVLYGCSGLVDIQTIDDALKGQVQSARR